TAPATDTSTTPSTPSPSPAPATAPPPAPTPNDDKPKAKPPKKPDAASSATSPDSSTASSPPHPQTSLDTHRSIAAPIACQPSRNGAARCSTSGAKQRRCSPRVRTRGVDSRRSEYPGSGTARYRRTSAPA